MRARIGFGVAVLMATSAASALAAGAPPVPSPDDAVSRACAAAGGMDAFRALGILAVTMTSDEVTQDGETSTRTKTMAFVPPGPVPGRFEVPKDGIIAADDGSGGWAVAHSRPDARPGTSYMVRRSLASFMFPLLFPFSLTWGGVAVTGVEPAVLAGKPVWRLHVVLPRSFFDTPQIATNWTVDLDQQSFAVVRAESPATDLGKGVTADGMRYTWSDAVKLAGVRLPGVQRVIGLDEVGHEKTHSRVDHLSYHVLPASDSARLFGNPIPPDQRPHAPAMVPPPLPPS